MKKESQKSKVKSLPQQAVSRGQKSKILYLFLLFTVHCSLFTVLYGCAATDLKEEASIHYRLGVVHLNEGNLPSALKELTAAVEKNPDDVAYHNAFGLAYYYRDLDNDAIKHFKEAIRLDSKFSEARTNLGVVYLKQKRWDDAISEFQIAAANIFYTAAETAYTNMGWAYFQKGDNEKAIDSYRKAINVNPRYSLAYNNLGLAYMKVNRDKDAAESFMSAIRYSPNYADAHYNLGLVSIKLKDKSKAQESFQEVIRLLPNSEMARSAQEKLNLLK
ncbi:MAG: tetratricopeptide repeat protein [Deltaproteobacteria bacterium]|nr:tetratricopeptide repeat protein [Deltaproteobacteria bacterium]